jgi:hypothetical protein
MINYFPKRSLIEIENNSSKTIIIKANLYNINAHLITTWKLEDQSSQNIQLPINKLSSGEYIVKIYTSIGEFSKKIIIP